MTQTLGFFFSGGGHPVNFTKPFPAVLGECSLHLSSSHKDSCNVVTLVNRQTSNQELLPGERSTHVCGVLAIR
jgi:hypothetical protein